MKRQQVENIIAEYFRETDISDIATQDGSQYHARILIAILESSGVLPTRGLNTLTSEELEILALKNEIYDKYNK